MNKKFLHLSFALLLFGQPFAASADENADQQQKDQENKNRIYGTKHPWENTMPYGTQYTPPSSPPGAADEVSKPEVSDKKKAAKTTKKHVRKHAAAKVTAKKVTVKQSTTVQKKS